MTLNYTFARLPFVAAAALVTVTSFTLTAPANAAAAEAASVAVAEAAPVSAEPAADASKKICVNERFTGSRMSQKVCKTKAQWEALGGLPSK